MLGIGTTSGKARWTTLNLGGARPRLLVGQDLVGVVEIESESVPAIEKETAGEIEEGADPPHPATSPSQIHPLADPEPTNGESLSLI